MKLPSYDSDTAEYNYSAPMPPQKPVQFDPDSYNKLSKMTSEGGFPLTIYQISNEIRSKMSKEKTVDEVPTFWYLQIGDCVTLLENKKESISVFKTLTLAEYAIFVNIYNDMIDSYKVH